MRVVIICAAGYISGKEKIMISLLKGLASSGDEVFCITSSWGNGQFAQFLAEEKIPFAKLRLGFISKTLNWDAARMTLTQLFYLPALLLKYKRIISNFRPDIVIHSNFHHTFLLFPAIRAGNAVHVYHSHESIGSSPFYKRLFTLFNNKIGLFVGVSGYVSSKMRSLGIPAAKLKTIHNGVEAIASKPTQTYSSQVFTIGIAGQVGAWKGHEDLLEAINIVRMNDPGLQFKLYIFGDGKPEFMKVLHTLITEKKLEDIVKFNGFVTNLKDIYTGLQVLCVPSRSEEPFATSALEAGLFAVPVIVSRRGGFPEIVQQGHNGFIVEANAPTELATCLTRLIKDPLLAKQIGLNHQAVVEDLFSYKNFIGNWRDTLETLTHGNKTLHAN